MKKYVSAMIVITTIILFGYVYHKNPQVEKYGGVDNKCNNGDEGYYKHKDGVVYCRFYNSLEVQALQDVDVDSFQIITKDYGHNDYAKDKNHVYAGGDMIFGADPNAFVVLSDGYAKDKNHVYLHDSIFDNNYLVGGKKFGTKAGGISPDPDTFQVLEGGTYTKDKVNGYYNNVMIRGDTIDAKTLQVLTYYIAKDKNHLYLDGVIVDEADVTTVEVLDERCAKDKYNRYCATGSFVYTLGPTMYDSKLIEKPYTITQEP